MDIYRKVEDVVETLSNAKDRGKSCAILIGAGCSKSAGIPLAGEIVDHIKDRYPRAYKRAEEKAKTTPIYPECMAKLSSSERRDMIGNYVDKASINWTHVAIAQLIKHGYVDRVLTTNFDPLVVRACALVGEFPAVYDLAASHAFKSDYVLDKSVFYLHGQRTGFVMKHTREECGAQMPFLTPVFQDTLNGRVMVVVGYSGDCDPVFEHLAAVENFDNCLFWVGYKDSDPAEHVRTRLLEQTKDAYFIRGHDSDDFLIKLAQHLEAFPPELVEKPFTHLEGLFDSLLPFPMPDVIVGDDVPDPLAEARNKVRKAIDDIEQDPQTANDFKRTAAFVSGDYEAAAEHPTDFSDLSPEMLDNLAWAGVLEANRLSDKALEAVGKEADNLFQDAYDHYEAALRIKPDMHEALNNWGIALTDQAKTKTGEEAICLLRRASNHFKSALTIKPDKHDTLHNWGVALSAEARMEEGIKAATLFKAASEKYELAVKLVPDDPEALTGWGTALCDLAATEPKDDAVTLFRSACQKFETALGIDPTMHEALSNWGLALAYQAKTGTPEEANALLQEAGEKYEAALRIRPDDAQTLCNWGAALSNQAMTNTGEEADALFGDALQKLEASLTIRPHYPEALNNRGTALTAQAATKTEGEADSLFKIAYDQFESAIKIEPEMRDAINNWGIALASQAKMKTGEEAEVLYALAQQKFTKVEALRPGYSAYDMGCIASLHGNETECHDWLEKSRNTGYLPTREYIVNDTDLDGVRDKPWFQEFMASL